MLIATSPSETSWPLATRAQQGMALGLGNQAGDEIARVANEAKLENRMGDKAYDIDALDESLHAEGVTNRRFV